MAEECCCSSRRWPVLLRCCRRSAVGTVLLLVAMVSFVSFGNHFSGRMCPKSNLTFRCAALAITGVGVIALLTTSYIIAAFKDPGRVPCDIAPPGAAFNAEKCSKCWYYVCGTWCGAHAYA